MVLTGSMEEVMDGLRAVKKMMLAPVPQDDELVNAQVSLVHKFRHRILAQGGFKSLDLSRAHLSEPYLCKAIPLLKLANYEWLTVLKLDGCQLTNKGMLQLRDFFQSQHSVLNGHSTLQVLSLQKCGLTFWQNDVPGGSQRTQSD